MGSEIGEMYGNFIRVVGGQNGAGFGWDNVGQVVSFTAL